MKKEDSSDKKEETKADSADKKDDAENKKVEAKAAEKKEDKKEEKSEEKAKSEDKKPEGKSETKAEAGVGAREKMGDSLNDAVAKKEKKGKKPADAQEKATPPPFPGYVPVRETLKTVATSQITQELINRPDNLHHLLLTDSNNLLMSLEHDFPEICKLITIGKSVEGREMRVLEIDYQKKPKDSSLLELDTNRHHQDGNLVQVGDDEDGAEADVMAAAVDNTLKDGIPDPEKENAVV